QKAGSGRATLLGNNSAYAGVITVNGGEMVITSANALGTAAGGTVVNSGFTLMIDGSAGAISSAEPLNVNGAGFNGPGAIRNVAGSNTWTGAVTLAGATTIGVDTGSQLNISAAIGGGAQNLTKLLGGTLMFSGSTANTYTGTTFVYEGTLLLNKSA